MNASTNMIRVNGGIMVELHKLPDESEEQFIWRLGQAKDAGTLDMGWDEIADLKP